MLIHLKDPVGDKVGYLPWRALDRADIEQDVAAGVAFAAAGYRADRRFVLTVDQNCVPTGVPLASRVPDALLAHRCAITFGDSGGPILRRLERAGGAEFELVAIHVAVSMRNGKRTGIALASNAFAASAHKAQLPPRQEKIQ